MAAQYTDDERKILGCRHGYNYCPGCLVNTVAFDGHCCICKEVFPELAQETGATQAEPVTKNIFKKIVLTRKPVYEEEVKKFNKFSLTVNSKIRYNLIKSESSTTSNLTKGDNIMAITNNPTVVKTPLSKAAETPEGKTKLEASIAAAEKVRQLKLAAKKPATKVAKVTKAPSVPKGETKREPSATGTLIKMLLEKKHTDDHILDTVNKQFKKEFNQSFISTCRTRLNTQEKYMQSAVAAAGGRKILPIERIEKK
jgi:hypothetical protein